MANLLRNLGFLARHTAHQLVVAPHRKRQWRATVGPTVVLRNRLRFEVHPRQYVDKHIFVDGIYESRFLEWLVRVLPGGTMLDVGANIGNHALYLGRKFRQVHCFEPNPTVIERLRRNIALNDAANIVVHEVGLGADDALLPFEQVSKSLGQSRFVAEPTEHTRFLRVRRGDMVVADLGLDRIDYIKIDVEGFEPHVLDGLRDTIRMHRPIISFEYHGQLSDPSVFAGIRRALPGYRIVEPCLEPGSGSYVRKALFYLAYAGDPVLDVVDVPDRRSYPYLVAFPH